MVKILRLMRNWENIWSASLCSLEHKTQFAILSSNQEELVYGMFLENIFYFSHSGDSFMLFYSHPFTRNSLKMVVQS